MATAAALSKSVKKTSEVKEKEIDNEKDEHTECGKKVTKDGIQCEICDKWNHSKFHSVNYCTPQNEAKPPGRLKAFITKYYVNNLNKFDSAFEKHYPRVYSIYRLFKNGVTEFLSDARIYYGVTTGVWSGKPLEKFTRKQLQVYEQMPKDMLHSVPLMIVLPLPFVPYLFFPVAYFFPKRLLCRHFWTPQQRLDFALHDLRVNRLPQYPKIISYLEANVTSIKDTGRRKVLDSILLQISNNTSPEVDAIIDVRDVFASFPFILEHLIENDRIHLGHLCRSINFSSRPSKLWRSLDQMHAIDRAICREGIGSLSLAELQQACFTRGLNAVGVEESGLRCYLEDWTKITRSLDDEP